MDISKIISITLIDKVYLGLIVLMVIVGCSNEKVKTNEFNYLSFSFHGEYNDSSDIKAYEILSDGKCFIFVGTNKKNESGLFTKKISSQQLGEVIDEFRKVTHHKNKFYEGQFIQSKYFNVLLKTNDTLIRINGDYSSLPDELHKYFQSLYKLILKGSKKINGKYTFKSHPVINRHIPVPVIEPIG